MLARLDTTFATQRRFMADASHELRTPVAAIRSMTDVALAGSSTFAECKRVLRRVNVQAEQLGTLISDLLLLARADEDGPAMDHLPLRLDLRIAEVAAVAEASAQERGLALETRTSGPLLVLGDEARLIQAVSNLLENAIAYTHEGGRISVTAAQHDANATFTVRDTGVGIGAEHLPHIFQRFYRGDHARTRSAGGTGLGLAIVDWVISAHGGTIAVESQVGQGTAFTVTLPLVGPQDPTETTTVRGGHVSA
jgi:two-component system OmpR family sensor kinase